MDSFKEQIVKKENTSKDTMMRFVIAIAAILLVSAIVVGTMMTGGGLLPIAFLIGAGIVYGGFYLIQNLNLEYEYIFTNGEMDVDKIMAARSRKRLITVKMSDATDIGEYKDDGKGDRTTVIASAMNSGLTDWYLDFKHPDHGDTRLIFTPDDDMLRVIKSHLPRNVRNKVNVSERSSEEL